MNTKAWTLATRAVAAAGAAALVSVVGFPATVSAGQTAPTDPTAEVTTTTCGAEGGTIVVNIFDDSSERYNVLLDGVIVPGPEEGGTFSDTDEGEEPVIIGPLADGTYNVQVIWLPSENNEVDDEILNEDVTIDCVTDATPPAPPAPPGPVTEPVVANPTFTG